MDWISQNSLIKLYLIIIKQQEHESQIGTILHLVVTESNAGADYKLCVEKDSDFGFRMSTVTAFSSVISVCSFL